MMTRASRCGLLVVAASLLLAASGAQAGPKMEFGDGGFLTLGVLGQVHGSWTDDAKDQEDIYLRRARLIFSGQIVDGVKVFAETDYPNAGRTGTSASFIMQDAFTDVRLYDAHWAQVGLEPLPFSFENSSSAGTLLGLDFNTESIKFTNALNYRDLGLMVHGNFGPWVSYKAGVFDGYDAGVKSEGAEMRFTGHIAVNPVGAAESGWFFNQVRLDRPTYVSLGAGVDTQKDATVSAAGALRDSKAWVVDLQSGVKIADVAHVTANGAYYHWDNAVFEGKTAFVEAGVLWSNLMLTGKWSLQDPDGGDSIKDYTVGVDHFFKGHNARAGIEYRFGDSTDNVLVGVQFLL
ncbi:MAG TPA: porin [bacterium]